MLSNEARAKKKEKDQVSLRLLRIFRQNLEASWMAYWLVPAFAGFQVIGGFFNSDVGGRIIEC